MPWSESRARVEMDVERLAALGASTCYGMPRPNTKQALLRKRAPHTMFTPRRWLDMRLLNSLTPVYETIREAWEDFRLLALVKASGRKALLAELMEASTGRGESAGMVPVTLDCQALRDKIMREMARGHGGARPARSRP